MLQILEEQLECFSRWRFVYNWMEEVKCLSIQTGKSHKQNPPTVIHGVQLYQ